MSQYCLHFYVSGKVQGVWFRASTQEKAQQLKLTGWVKNLHDGRVEIFACGEQQQLRLFEDWLYIGPPLASVVKVDKKQEPWQDLSNFLID